ncbi:type IV pili methyl-accepting chemotaxis transducer N-terminal domain-containing protein [Aquimarina sp. MMG015]|uniref:type IV pili methyl-accepting chemotaxis transducer N-terminal domain-containing protein n=1 Tax=Aquimarina sp. MMG015 TaxID=2822689 RepID=UPI001B39FE10|nr:type IV pili methyl-accepting chemotaxis transducer N-terminal domain-containing protein [Aquimarina sp. MMG015]MBQ4805761.1 type IV pili methyl-accepting chemotaxis transducer N-terminal domain-containing protein [Aquimarina sp. MMG015]
MKKNFTFKSIMLLFLFGIVASSTNTISAQQNIKYGMLTFNKAVNISGKQRMLSQKMAKSYLYLVENPSDAKAKRDLLTSKIIFEKQNGIINQNSSYKVTKDRITKVNGIWVEFKKLIESTPNYDNAKKIIDLNTDLLKATNDVVSAVIVESKGANKNDQDLLEDDGSGESDLELKQIINMAGRQRMLSQRLALYYFANQTTLKTKNSEQMLNNVFNEIDGAITMLLISNFNNEKIDEKLGLAMTKWESVKNNKKKLMNQGFKPSEMYKISNDLTKAFNTVTGLYEKVKI